MTDARFVIGLCREFKCLPSQLFQEDGEFLRLLEIEALGRPKDQEGGVAE